MPYRVSLLSLLTILALAGCGSAPKSEEEVGKRIIGMPAGDFFQEFGRPRSRTEQPDGSAVYLWQSSTGATPPGPHGEDERICRLRLVADKRGRIEGASVLADFQGRTSTSRCSELFRRK